MLRRRKEDVTKDIPPKEETIIDVELTMVQKKYYRAIYERNHSVLNKVCTALGFCLRMQVFISFLNLDSSLQWSSCSFPPAFC